MNMIQVDLVAFKGNLQMTTWMEKRVELEVGRLVRFHNETTWWKIKKIYNIELDKTELEMNRKWDNNNYDKHVTTSMKERTK